MRGDAKGPRIRAEDSIETDHLPPARLVTVIRGQPGNVCFRQAVCFGVFAVLRHDLLPSAARPDFLRFGRYQTSYRQPSFQ